MPDDLKERATCKTCGQTESMEHILFSCTATGSEVIWKLLTTLWAANGKSAPDISWGSVVAGPCLEFGEDIACKDDTAAVRR